MRKHLRNLRVLLCFIFLASSTSSLGDSTEVITRRGDTSLWFDHRDEGATLPPKNLGDDILYQIFLDRFENGNEANDCVFGGRFCDPSQNDWYRYWGGDLRGLINRLDYLKELGVTKIWITPIFENNQVVVRRQKHGRSVNVTSYHGYWIKDWFRLNPFFTDQGVLDFNVVRELVEAASPMTILLDSVTNHTSPADATADSLEYLNSLQPLQSGQAHRGALFENGQYVTSLTEDEDREGQVGYQAYFHQNGDIENWDDLWEVENYRLDGLADLDQDNPIVYDYMSRAHKFWFEQVPGLGGYRMDTIKHVNQDYWDRFNSDIFGDFSEKTIVGEYFNAGPYYENSHPFYKQTNMSMFDFDFRYVMSDVFLRNEPMWLITDLWAKDKDLIDANQLITFLDNHDVPRLRGRGMSQTRMRQAIAVWLMGRGVPCIYYGMEQDLFHPGDPGDPYNRPQMVSFDQSSDFFKYFKTLIDLRRSNPAVRAGKTHVVHLSEHIIAFERVLGDRSVLVVTSKNPRGGEDRFSLKDLTLPNGDYQEVLSGTTYSVQGGEMPVALSNGRVLLFSR